MAEILSQKQKEAERGFSERDLTVFEHALSGSGQVVSDGDIDHQVGTGNIDDPLVSLFKKDPSLVLTPLDLKRGTSVDDINKARLAKGSYSDALVMVLYGPPVKFFELAGSGKKPVLELTALDESGLNREIAVGFYNAGNQRVTLEESEIASLMVDPKFQPIIKGHSVDEQGIVHYSINTSNPS